MTDEVVNDQLVLISGESGTGKSASLAEIRNHAGTLYMNCESGKRLPFRNKFQTAVITDPFQVYEGFEYANNDKDIENIVVDTLTFLMDMFESNYIIGSSNTMQGWSNYAQFFKNLMQNYVAKSTKKVIFLAHTRQDLDEKAMEMKTQVPVKGALKNNGIEAYFSTVVSTKKVAIKDLKDYQSKLLNITDDDEMLGYKHVFQTRPTKTTIGERIRSPMGMFTVEETFMDNDAQKLLDHLHEYYA